MIDIKSKFYPYDGYKRFALDSIYKNIAKETREDRNKLEIEKRGKRKLKKEQLQSEEEKVKEL